MRRYSGPWTPKPPRQPCQTLADIAADPHFAARGMLQRIALPDGLALDVPGVVPKLSATPGLGEHTEAVLRDGWQNINRQT